MSNKLTQAERLLNYLQSNNHIEPLRAWTELGIYRLSARINELRHLGYDIETTRTSSVNKFGETCYYAEYVLQC